MDAYLAVVSKREVRAYEDRAIPDDVLERILEAGRATGSSKNTQPWRFIVITGRERLRELAKSVSRPANLERCPVAIAIAMTAGGPFDAGRAAQNMMVAAWDVGVGTCPNTPRDADSIHRALGVPDGVKVVTILTLGYPAEGEPRPPRKASSKGVLRRIKRAPLDQLVDRETFRS